MYTLVYAVAVTAMANAMAAGLEKLGRESRMRDPREFQKGHGEPTHGVVVDALAPNAERIREEYERMGQKVLTVGKNTPLASISSGEFLKQLFEDPEAEAQASETASPAAPPAAKTAVPKNAVAKSE